MKIALSPVDWLMIPMGMIVGLVMVFVLFWVGLAGRAAFWVPLGIPESEDSHDERGPAVKAYLWRDLSWNWIRVLVEEILGCLGDAGAGG